MLARIAICDPLPVFRRGIQAILRDAGFDAEAPEDLLTWIRDERPVLVVMTIQAPKDIALLEQACRVRPDVVVVALLIDQSLPAQVGVLQAGAVSVVPRDASPQAMRDALVAVVHGTSLLPVEVVRALTVAPLPTTDDRSPTPAERDWLRQLASGRTINQLAGQVGYSERMMFRLLRDLYTKVGARNRMEALMRAREAGWLAPD